MTIGRKVSFALKKWKPWGEKSFLFTGTINNNETIVKADFLKTLKYFFQTKYFFFFTNKTLKYKVI